MSELLGYYHDEPGKRDTEDLPAPRQGEKCLNCNQTHFHHNGWACRDENGGKAFDYLPWEERYVTVSMRRSRNLPPKGKYAHLYLGSAPHADVVKEPTPKVDLSDWRTWAYKEPGHCGCGIHKSMCDYHR